MIAADLKWWTHPELCLLHEWMKRQALTAAVAAGLTQQTVAWLLDQWQAVAQQALDQIVQLASVDWTAG